MVSVQPNAILVMGGRKRYRNQSLGEDTLADGVIIDAQTRQVKRKVCTLGPSTFKFQTFRNSHCMTDTGYIFTLLQRDGIIYFAKIQEGNYGATTFERIGPISD